MVSFSDYEIYLLFLLLVKFHGSGKCENYSPDQSLVVNEILTSENNSMGFFAFVVWGLAK